MRALYKYIGDRKMRKKIIFLVIANIARGFPQKYLKWHVLNII
jgi:hypothetical protein